MKKQAYIAPQIEVMNLNMNQSIMTTSNVGFGTSVNSAAGAEGHELDDDFDW